MTNLSDVFPNKLVGVIRASSARVAARACLAAIEGGVATIEVTTTVPDWAEAVAEIRRNAEVPLGVGTVRNVETVAEAAAAGATFVVTPYLIPPIASECRRHGVLCVMGALTPTEVVQAVEAGADLVKVFPVQAMGGPRYIRWLAGPLPGIPLWVSGGVEIDQVSDYVRQGVAAIGLTTALFSFDSVESGNRLDIVAKARAAVAQLNDIAVVM